jgi:DNA-binding IclR family transcriptional regulator
MPVLIQSVTRALHILEALTSHTEGLSVKEIAQQVGLNVSTTHHLVNTLETGGYIAALANGRYSLGLAIPQLYSAFLMSFQPDVRLLEILNTLAKITRETTYINTWQNGDIIIQAIVESPQALRIGGMRVGFRGFAHARAGGKALLAYMAPDQLDSYLKEHPLTSLTPNTIHDKTTFKSHLNLVARQGYAIDREEFAEGVCCISAPILRADGQAVMALSVSAPVQRFIENEQQLINAVTGAAHEAAVNLGLRPLLAQTPRLDVKPDPATSTL